MSSKAQMSLLLVTNGVMQSYMDMLRLWIGLLESGVADIFDAAVLFFKKNAPILTGARRFLADMQSCFSLPRPSSQINRLGVESLLMDTVSQSKCLRDGQQVLCVF